MKKLVAFKWKPRAVVDIEKNVVIPAFNQFIILVAAFDLKERSPVFPVRSIS